MSRLEELIAALCPDGVEYKTLGELATDIFRGALRGIKFVQMVSPVLDMVKFIQRMEYGLISAYHLQMKLLFPIKNTLNMAIFFLLLLEKKSKI